MTSEQIGAMRREYESEGIDIDAMLADPYEQFRLWFAEAIETEQEDANAMVLATVAPDGAPSARVLLLKGIDRGFIFYTNYHSRKGREIEENRRGALVFWWRELNRQVRIEGVIRRVPEEMSDHYFASRPLGSRLSAAASPQSGLVESRQVLEGRVEELQRAHGEEGPARPSEWGGYRLEAESIEFWQGRRNRLHDRLVYRQSEETWVLERLAP